MSSLKLKPVVSPIVVTADYSFVALHATCDLMQWIMYANSHDCSALNMKIK